MIRLINLEHPYGKPEYSKPADAYLEQSSTLLESVFIKWVLGRC